MPINRSLFAALLVLCVEAANAEPSSNNHYVNVVGNFGDVRFAVEIADEPEERRKGLMLRKTLARSAGMLFVFERPQTVTFWMKNTLIPLDMIFVNRAGQIKHIHHNAIPHNKTPIFGGDDIYSVLEISGGLSETYGIKLGDRLVHPVFSEEP